MTYLPVSLQSILDATLVVAIDRMTLKQIKVETSYPEQPCLVNADSEKLKIAFLNILINATEAISSNSGRIAITLSAKSQYHRVEITDNGCGIDKENISKLFEPYFTSKRNGMGLGLAATLNILQSHQGIVDVHSQVGQGTTFTITFPKAVQVEQEQ